MLLCGFESRFGLQSPGFQRWEWMEVKKPESEGPGADLNLRYENPHFLALYPVSNSHPQNTVYCALKLFFFARAHVVI